LIVIDAIISPSVKGDVFAISTQILLGSIVPLHPFKRVYGLVISRTSPPSIRYLIIAMLSFGVCLVAIKPMVSVVFEIRLPMLISVWAFDVADKTFTSAGEINTWENVGLFVLLFITLKKAIKRTIKRIPQKEIMDLEFLRMKLSNPLISILPKYRI